MPEQPPDSLRDWMTHYLQMAVQGVRHPAPATVGTTNRASVTTRPTILHTDSPFSGHAP